MEAESYTYIVEIPAEEFERLEDVDKFLTANKIIGPSVNDRGNLVLIFEGELNEVKEKVLQMADLGDNISLFYSYYGPIKGETIGKGKLVNGDPLSIPKHLYVSVDHSDEAYQMHQEYSAIASKAKGYEAPVTMKELSVKEEVDQRIRVSQRYMKSSIRTAIREGNLDELNLQLEKGYWPTHEDVRFSQLMCLENKENKDIYQASERIYQVFSEGGSGKMLDAIRNYNLKGVEDLLEQGYVPTELHFEIAQRMNVIHEEEDSVNLKNLSNKIIGKLKIALQANREMRIAMRSAFANPIEETIETVRNVRSNWKEALRNDRYLGDVYNTFFHDKLKHIEAARIECAVMGIEPPDKKWVNGLTARVDQARKDSKMLKSLIAGNLEEVKKTIKEGANIKMIKPELHFGYMVKEKLRAMIRYLSLVIKEKNYIHKYGSGFKYNAPRERQSLKF